MQHRGSPGRALVPPLCLLAAGTLALSLAGTAAAEGKLTFIDVSSKGNHRLNETLHKTSPDNHFGELPQGELKFEAIRFKIGEQMVRVKGKNTDALPSEVKGIPVNAAFERLHILHSTGYGENPQMTEGTEIGAYTIRYADDTTERIPIVYGEDVRDWWDWPPRTDLKRAKVAWTGTNPFANTYERKIRLFAVTWTNPHPAKKVTSIDMNTAETECDPFLVALTAETK
jgi:hypothetical protein